MPELNPNKKLIAALEGLADKYNAEARYKSTFSGPWDNAPWEAVNDREKADMLLAAAQALRDQPGKPDAAKKPTAECDADAIKANLGSARKLLVRASDMARADKSASIATSAAVRGNIDTAVMLLDRTTAAVTKKPPIP